MLKQLPNILTISRIILLPVLIGLFFVPGADAAWAALWIYVFCAVTDFFDGYLARKFGTTSNFGTFLDPISDKIMVASLLIALATFDRLDGIWMIPAIIILMREFLIAGLREYLGPQNIKVPVSKLAKWKTGFQMTALGFLVIGDYGDSVMQTVFGFLTGGADIAGALLTGQVLLGIAAVITVITGWNYLKVGFKHI
ncbi:MAG: CDP-diacylglycerol--glycerol-3-phosphate 3-phosphatidyltransferase [Micavibrio aeruginosavorus]|uniref:CDP-diacylglycerol--glycerol-3-phosphate 3-phosphatidyltransferase n=1 Tax=Micavibrio aeruginosavorus TaxID=349221 RepID=A0A2W5N424_9BACT|nr:MAG: CDP-diacylglycerol--glycerol-3-phosphate 3-phosphatidyltransferase [Micavibrio aeruginosavorus]